MGSRAKAALSGAKTVRWSSLSKVATMSASCTACTHSVSIGRWEAAVTTGSPDISAKLPIPERGTAEQPGPNGGALSGRSGGPAHPAANPSAATAAATTRTVRCTRRPFCGRRRAGTRAPPGPAPRNADNP
ncbi:protein of unknown function (plasmid) [Streptantibioticus cattleyicolor NRRL 8057 = DSM 46488]|nr:protein of unknown function [Streptantibioticus cattleyicolor NRRL 8057 = DSM 46488]